MIERHASRRSDVTSSAELPTVWRARAADLRAWGAAESAACAFERAALELETALSAADGELLSLAAASSESHYSEDHLRRLVRDRLVPAVRRGRRLFFRRADLPRKPTLVDAASDVRYDPIADARRVAARRTDGARTNGTHTAD